MAREVSKSTVKTGPTAGLKDVDAPGPGPSLFASLTEFPRTAVEAMTMFAAWLPLVHLSPRGDSHPVMVLPGFMGGDASTRALREFLRALGYKPLPWSLGTNTGNPNQLEQITRRFYRLQHTPGTQVSLVGQSLGGVYARQIATQFPDAVRCVITLGSPYRATHSGSTSPLVAQLFEEMSGLTIEELREIVPQPDQHTHLPMPATSIYSKLDGVVGWQTCIEPESALSENIHIGGSHTGMAMNPLILTVIADRLAQNPENWQKFSASCYEKSYARMFCGSREESGSSAQSSNHA